MLRTAFTALIALVVAFVSSVAALQFELAMYPDEAGDRGFGLVVVGAMETATYAWLYAIAVGFAVTRTFHLSGWRRIVGTTGLLVIPPLLVEAAHAYDSLDDPWKALEYVIASLLLPFVASLAVAIAGMARGSQLNRQAAKAVPDRTGNGRQSL